MTSASYRSRYKISVFLSYPKPYMEVQEDFINKVCHHLDGLGLAPRTLGVTDYDMDAPLKAIRRLMLESNGIITIAFRRTYVEKAIANHGSDIHGRFSYPVSDQWLTSPWAHIEPAMAFQIGLPILIFREKGVMEDGVLEKGVVGTYMPEFDTTSPFDEYFAAPEWNDLIRKWESQVRSVVERKGNPPQLYF